MNLLDICFYRFNSSQLGVRGWGKLYATVPIFLYFLDHIMETILGLYAETSFHTMQQDIGIFDFINILRYICYLITLSLGYIFIIHMDVIQCGVEK